MGQGAWSSLISGGVAKEGRPDFRLLEDWLNYFGMLRFLPTMQKVHLLPFVASFLVAISCLGLTRAEEPQAGDEGLRVQIFLDQECFGPGFLDGKPGKFTMSAVYAYNRFRGRSPGDWDELAKEARAAVENLYAIATVPKLAKDFINPKLPRKYEDTVGLKMMAYRSYLEFMAERYHTSESFLIELNGKKRAYGLKPGSTLEVPNIEPFLIEKLAHGRSHKRDEILSQRNVVIDTSTRQMFIYDPTVSASSSPGAAVALSDDGEPLGKLVARFPITPGQEKFIHRGTWKVVNSVEFPTWRYDKQLLKTGKRGKKAYQVPYGPNNPIGVIWNGLSKSGIGIHGTSSPRTIGRSVSAGCYRLSNWDAARFPDYVRPGASVTVR